MNPARIFVGLCLAWAAVALAAQVRRARRGRRADLSRPAGSPARGLLYSFTGAMSPRHKETVSRHPVAFGVGLLFHAGTLLGLLTVLLSVVGPTLGSLWLRSLRLLFALSLLAGLVLLVRRLVSVNLRKISVPDDYLAILATCGLLAFAGRAPGGHLLALWVYAGALLLYLPLGKLRHIVFFFVARGDLGRRLGWRGVYPPPRTRVEQTDGIRP